MGENVANSLPAFGFLTVLEDPQHGFFGGYLLLSELGRPLEFHCSTPVLPNEAQKILYGASLRPYVLGELIGQTLVEQAQIPAEIILTDLQEMLSLALLREENIACIAESETQKNTCQDLNSSQQTAAPKFTVNHLQIFGSTTCQWQPEQIRQAIAPLTRSIELLEPFQRIKEAIQEAQRISTTPNDTDHESSAAA